MFRLLSSRFFSPRWLALLLLSVFPGATAFSETAHPLVLTGTTGNYQLVNGIAGAQIFYDAQYFGANTVIANVEGGHIWAGHEAFDRSNFGLTSGPSLYVSSATSDTSAPLEWQIDYHATAVGQILAGSGQNLSYLTAGMAPFAELWSGSIATEFNTDGTFEIDDASLITPYKAFFNGIEGRKADVINSSWGGDDPSGREYYTKAIDGLIRQNSTVAFVVAAGNDGPGSNTVGGPATGYNGISVGALGGPNFLTPSDFSSAGPSDFYDPQKDEVITGVRATVHLAAPGENFVAAYYGGTGGGGGVTEPADPLPTDYYLIEANGTSFAAPVVAGGISLLKDVVYGGFYDLNEETALDSRVIRSVLMASATKTIGWDNGQVLVGNVIRTTQALDWKTGAGALDLTSAAVTYLFGTTDVEGLSGGEVASVGWDFGSVALGGHNDYVFDDALYSLFDTPIELTISLNWFVNVGFDNDTNLVSDESFANLDLELWTITETGFTDLVAISESDYNNSELLRIVLDSDKKYGFRVVFNGVVYDLNDTLLSESYGVAWFAIPEPSAPVLLAGAAILLIAVRLTALRLAALVFQPLRQFRGGVILHRIPRPEQAHAGVPKRKANGQREAHPLRAHQVDLAPVRAHNALHDHQPEPGALLLRREIRLEKVAHVVRRNAAPRVGEADGDVAVVHVGANPKNAPGFHRLEGVLDHVVDRLLDLVAVHFQQRKIRAQFLLHDRVPVRDFRFEERHRFAHQPIDVLRARLQRRRADRPQKLVDDRIESRDLLLGYFHGLLQGAARLVGQLPQSSLEQLQMDVERIERVAEFMRHPGGQQREGGEPFGFQRLFRGAARLRDVAQDDGVADDDARFVLFLPDFALQRGNVEIEDAVFGIENLHVAADHLFRAARHLAPVQPPKPL